MSSLTRHAQRAPDSSPLFPNFSQCARFIELIARLQRERCGDSVPLTPAQIERLTGIPETDQIAIRQTLMLAGRLRLEVRDRRWAYALAGEQA